MKKYKILSLIAFMAIFSAFKIQQKPTLYTIGDSTMRNSNQETWGWGTLVSDYFDLNKINVENNAMAGRSTRTFIKEGRWKKVDSLLKPGDFVIMGFGHNEGAKPDTNKAGYRGVLKGTGEETVELTWKDGLKETVHTYGWYIRKFIKDTKAKGATPVVVSMIPRNEWADGKVKRADNDYGKWAKEIAQQEGAYFIDLNGITADKYDKMGPDAVKALFPKDHTHTNKEGANINAQSVTEGIRMQPKLALNKYLKINK